MVSSLVQVALGGALGATLRWLVGVGVARVWGVSGFPVAVMGVNVVGSFLMGVCVVWAAQRSGAVWAPFLMTGLLGGFTTFSAFSLEAVTLFERGATSQAVAYVALSVGLSIAGLVLGLWVARGIWA